MKKKIFVVGSGNYYANWLQMEDAETLEDADLVLFTGGEDVWPGIYHEPVGKHTMFNVQRDLREQNFFNRAFELGKPMIGICRGSQLLCALSGGRLVQHQYNPDYIHEIQTSSGEKLEITSTHHQAQYPYDMLREEYELLAWTENASPYHLDGNNVEISRKKFREAEIVFYNKTKALGIQGHPEDLWNTAGYENLFKYLKGLVNNYLLK